MGKLLSLDRFQEDFGLEFANPEEEVSDNSLRCRALRRALVRVIRDELTPCQRQVVLLYFMEGKKIPAIAEQLGVNKSTVSRTLKRAKANLKRYLQYALPRNDEV